jgi:hypothetical protein
LTGGVEIATGLYAARVIPDGSRLVSRLIKMYFFSFRLIPELHNKPA